MPEGAQTSDEWHALATLSDPRRRQIFEYLSTLHQSRSRDQIADEFGLSRSAAAFHLDRLARAGLLEVTFARPAGRGGPGAGRPTKRYTAAAEVQGSIPRRDYQRVATILAGALAGESDDTMWNAVLTTAFTAGVDAGSQRPHDEGADPLVEVAAALDACGYASDRQRQDRLIMRNCPYRAVADHHPEVVCAVSERFIAGVIDGMSMRPLLRVAGDGTAPNCCVSVTQR